MFGVAVYRRFGNVDRTYLQG